MNNQIAYCGLACFLCSKYGSCIGCRSGACENREWCRNYQCCHDRNLDGCWECPEFPCSGSMLDNTRIRAFARFVREYGEDELVRCLKRNDENGIAYHYENQLTGDYDKGRTEEEIIEIIKYGMRGA